MVTVYLSFAEVQTFQSEPINYGKINHQGIWANSVKQIADPKLKAEDCKSSAAAPSILVNITISRGEIHSFAIQPLQLK